MEHNSHGWSWNRAREPARTWSSQGLSRWVDWSDRNTCVLFGDGAGAVVITATDVEKDAVALAEGRTSHWMHSASAIRETETGTGTETETERQRERERG